LDALPAAVAEALRGLAPAVERAATAGWSVELAARALDGLRDALVAGVVDATLPGAAADVVAPARQELVRLWDGIWFNEAVGTARWPFSWEHLVARLQAPDAAAARLERTRDDAVVLGAARSAARAQVARATAELRRAEEQGAPRVEVQRLQRELQRAEQLDARVMAELRRTVGQQLTAEGLLAEAQRQAQDARRALDGLAVTLAQTARTLSAADTSRDGRTGTPRTGTVRTGSAAGRQGLAPVHAEVRPEVLLDRLGEQSAARGEIFDGEVLDGEVPGPADQAGPSTTVLNRAQASAPADRVQTVTQEPGQTYRVVEVDPAAENAGATGEPVTATAEVTGVVGPAVAATAEVTGVVGQPATPAASAATASGPGLLDRLRAVRPESVVTGFYGALARLGGWLGGLAGRAAAAFLPVTGAAPLRHEAPVRLARPEAPIPVARPRTQVPVARPGAALRIARALEGTAADDAPVHQVPVGRLRPLAGGLAVDGRPAVGGPAAPPRPVTRRGRPDARLASGIRHTRMTWVAPPAWTERLAERSLRGAEYDLAPATRSLLAAMRGLQEIRQVQPANSLRADHKVSDFLASRITGDAAANVMRRVLDHQAERDVVDRVHDLGRRVRPGIHGNETWGQAGPVSRRLTTGMLHSLVALTEWAQRLGANPATRTGLTEADLREPADFVHLLREVFGTALRDGQNEALNTAGPLDQRARDREALEAAAEPVTEARYDAVWAEFARRLTELRQGTPGPLYTADALVDFAGNILSGTATLAGESAGQGAAEPGQGAAEPGQGAAESGPQTGDARLDARLAALSLPPDRYGSVWGNAGLPQRLLTQLRQMYLEDPTVPARTVLWLQATVDGRLSGPELIRRLTAQGQSFLQATGESWVPQPRPQADARPAVPLPAHAPVRFLDAGVEVALLDLAYHLQWRRENPGHPVVSGPLDIARLVAGLRGAYREALAGLVENSTAPATLASARRSLTALNGPRGQQTWWGITTVLAALQDGAPGKDAGTAMRTTTLVLAANRGLAEATVRSATQVAPLPSAVAAAAGRPRLAELIDRTWGRPGEGPSAADSAHGEAGGTVSALQALLLGERPAQELRQDLLSALAGRAGQVVLGSRLAEGAVDLTVADAAAVRLLDVGVQLAVRDLQPQEAFAGGRSGTGTVMATPDLVRLLQQVYRERLHELLGEAIDAPAAQAAQRSLDLLASPDGQAFWARAAARAAEPAPGPSRPATAGEPVARA
ncbi:MAG TPA: hypothetical protein VFP72_23100, partial [Kineosporiaceae bacterium]|nr:hypothetical protein [Kineosporiaceae bacterium]